MAQPEQRMGQRRDELRKRSLPFDGYPRQESRRRSNSGGLGRWCSQETGPGAEKRKGAKVWRRRAARRFVCRARLSWNTGLGAAAELGGVVVGVGFFGGICSRAAECFFRKVQFLSRWRSPRTFCSLRAPLNFQRGVSCPRPATVWRPRAVGHMLPRWSRRLRYPLRINVGGGTSARCTLLRLLIRSDAPGS